MLGKILGYVSFAQSLSVYQIKRYPSNKIPIGGFILTYLSAYYVFSRIRLNKKIEDLKSRISHENGIRVNFKINQN